MTYAADYAAAHDSNPLIDPSAYHEARLGQEEVTLSELAARGGRITRVRWLTEAIGPRQRIADISYVHGEIDGKPVRVSITAHLMLIPFPKMTSALIEWAKEEGVYAKGIGLIDRGNWSILT